MDFDNFNDKLNKKFPNLYCFRNYNRYNMNSQRSDTNE